MMFCKIMLFTAILLNSFLLLAQEEENILSIGVYGLVSSPFILNQNNYESLNECPSVDGSDLAYDLSLKSGFSAKISYSWKKQWGISTGVEYLAKGQNYADDFRPGGICPGIYSVKRKVKLNYLTFPIYFQFNKGISPKFEYIFDLGLYAAILANGKEFVNSGGKDLSNIDPISVKFKTFDFGIDFLNTIEYKATRNISVSAAFRVNYSFLDINGATVKNNPWFTSTMKDYKKSSNLLLGLQIGARYKFYKAKSPFNKKEN